MQYRLARCMSHLTGSTVTLDLTYFQYPFETILFVHQALPFGTSLDIVSCPFYLCGFFLVGFYNGCDAFCLGRDHHHYRHDYLPWEQKNRLCEVYNTVPHPNYFSRLVSQHEPHYQLVDFIHSGNRWHHLVRLSELPSSPLA